LVAENFHVEPVTWSEAAALLRAIRTEVFVREQRVPAALEWDGLDEAALHVLARTQAGEAVGTARLLIEHTASARELTEHAPNARELTEHAPNARELTEHAPNARVGRIGRMAVRRTWRGRGIGAAMLEKLIEIARAQCCAELYLHAQTHAIDFYARHGFVAEGEVFPEADIAHRSMRLMIGI
jgi:predicted GNAT family N-acyltransferase